MEKYCFPFSRSCSFLILYNKDKQPCILIIIDINNVQLSIIKKISYSFPTSIQPKYIQTIKNKIKHGELKINEIFNFILLPIFHPFHDRNVSLYISSRISL
jgi:hypothetical protein